MADQNVQTTIGSPIEWYKLEVMRDVVNVKEAWEYYHKQKELGVQASLNVVHARTTSLFNGCVAYLTRKWDADRIKRMKKFLFEDLTWTEKDLLQVFWDIQIQLDSDNITKMDTRRSYDGTRVEKENANFGD